VIEFQLDETSGVATYLQLVQQVHQALRMGMLEPGDQLPTAQQVVARLAINPNTVPGPHQRAGPRPVLGRHPDQPGGLGARLPEPGRR
jgi:Bacterial regulatory proteins, gntR family